MNSYAWKSAFRVVVLHLFCISIIIIFLLHKSDFSLILVNSIPFPCLLQTHEIQFQSNEIHFLTCEIEFQLYETHFQTFETEFQLYEIQFWTYEIHE